MKVKATVFPLLIFPSAVLSQACTPEQILADDCLFIFRLDGVCDADGLICRESTDCFDCDPCRPFDDTSCDQCASKGCLWCTLPSGYGLCSSPSFENVYPDLCDPANGGSQFTSTCDDVPPPDTGECDIFNDSCDTQLDLVCNAGGLCDENTDCFDCDPCQSYRFGGCDECTSNGCAWCTTASGIGVCSSSSIAAAYPNACGGTEYSTACEGSGPRVCDAENDPCVFKYDGICSANGVTCAENTDCFDCDPCQAFRFVGCEECTANGCLWCGKDSLCLSSASFLPESVTCGASDFVAACPNGSADPFSDPLFEAQSWIYDQINVKEVWESGITGAGIGIRINDNGVDSTHPEFSSRFDASSSCQISLPVSLDKKFGHGSTCAAIAAGAGGNGVCSVGIAPDAAVSACRVVITPEGDIIDQEDFDQLTPEAGDYSYLYKYMDNMQVSSNSYGPRTCSSLSGRRLQASCPFDPDASNSPCTSSACAGADWGDAVQSFECETHIVRYCQIFYENDVQGCISFLDLFVECDYSRQAPEERDAIIKGVTEGRNGRGIIYVFASGNSFDEGADVNFDGMLNNRFTISVGSVGRLGRHASYSTPGAALFVSAPGGDFEFYTNNVVALAGGGCIDFGVGTSFAAPVVSGVVALMLQANPGLTWRDVQGVLASTSQKTDPDDPSWTTNAAGFHHSPLYGFGLVDASAAVNASKTWENFAREQQIIAESGSVNLPIADYPADPVVTSVTVNGSATFVAESVVVYLDLSHASRGHLNIVLTSPAGTESVLHPGKRPESSQLGVDERWKLATVRAWGEKPDGAWSLSLVDQKAGDVTECLDFAGWKAGFDPIGGVIEWECFVFSVLEICKDGAQGPGYSKFFTGGDLSDPFFANENGITPDVACCECGGGNAASEITDVLRSWRLVVYGHDEVAAASTEAPTPASAQIKNLQSHTVILICLSIAAIWHVWV